MELQHVFDQIQEISVENRSIMVSTGDFQESFGSIVEMFEGRLSHFRKNLTKVADSFPRKRKKSVQK